jgi:hypothetical protein
MQLMLQLGGSNGLRQQVALQGREQILIDRSRHEQGRYRFRCGIADRKLVSLRVVIRIGGKDRGLTRSGPLLGLHIVVRWPLPGDSSHQPVAEKARWRSMRLDLRNAPGLLLGPPLKLGEILVLLLRSEVPRWHGIVRAELGKQPGQRIVLWVGIPAGDEVGQAAAFGDARHWVMKTEHSATRGVIGAEGRIPGTDCRDRHQRGFVLFCEGSRHLGAGTNLLELCRFVLVKSRPGDCARRVGWLTIAPDEPGLAG